MRGAWVGCWALAGACTSSVVEDDATDETDAVVQTDETDSTDETDPSDETPNTDETDPTDDTPVADGDPCLREPATLTLGTGELWDEYTPLVDGQNLEMVSGGQGAHHLALAFSATQVSVVSILEIRMTHVASNTVLTVEDPIVLNVQLVPTAGPGKPWACAGTSTGLNGILNFPALGAEPNDPLRWEVLCGHEVRIDLSVRDPEGVRTLTDSVTVVVQPDSEDGPHCTGG